MARISMYLTEDEIEKLTGNSQRCAQLRFLQKQEIPHIQNKAGDIVILRYWLERMPFDKNVAEPVVSGTVKMRNFGA